MEIYVDYGLNFMEIKVVFTHIYQLVQRRGRRRYIYKQNLMSFRKHLLSNLVCEVRYVYKGTRYVLKYISLLEIGPIVCELWEAEIRRLLDQSLNIFVCPCVFLGRCVSRWPDTYIQ